MARRAVSDEDLWLAIVILFLFTMAGGIFAAYYGGLSSGLAFGFLVGLATILTVHYASKRMRPTTSENTPTIPGPSVQLYTFTIFVGFVLSLLGLYIAADSGLLFGQYICNGGVLCGQTYQTLVLKLWEGLGLFAVGLGILVFSILQIAKRQQRKP